MKKLIVVLSTSFLFVLTSCDKDKFVDELNFDHPQEEWKKQELLNMGFHEHNIEEFDDLFVVEDDIVIYKSAFGGILSSDGSDDIGPRQRRTQHLVNKNIVTGMIVEIHSSVPSNFHLPIMDAINAWNNLGTVVQFQLLQNPPSPHITIYADSNLPSPYNNLNPSVCGMAAFPNNGNPGDIISLNIDATSLTTNAKIQYAVTHLLGHTIGLTHTNSTSGTHIQCTPVVDAASVMNSNYCGNTGSISLNDEYAVRKLYSCNSWSSWVGADDLSLTGDINGDGNEDLVLINTSYIGGAIHVADLTTGHGIYTLQHIRTPGGQSHYRGWMDAGDRVHLGDANGDGREDLILINTKSVGQAVRIIDVKNDINIHQISHGTFDGWLDPNDKSFVGDANGDGRDDLILVNNNQGGTPLNDVIRVIDLQNGMDINMIDKSSFAGWLGLNDRVLLGDANGDNHEDLIFINTDYNGGAIRAVNLLTGLNISSINHGSPSAFLGLMDAGDRSFIGDADGDGKDDLILVNTSSSPNEAIRAIDLIGGATISTNPIVHGMGNFSGWMSPTDRIFIGDANGDDKDDLIFQNTDYNGDAFRVLNLLTGLNISSFSHANGAYQDWMDLPDRSHVCNSNGNTQDDFLMINVDPDGCGGVIRVMDLISGNDLLWLHYCD